MFNYELTSTWGWLTVATYLPPTICSLYVGEAIVLGFNSKGLDSRDRFKI